MGTALGSLTAHLGLNGVSKYAMSFYQVEGCLIHGYYGSWFVLLIRLSIATDLKTCICEL